MMIPIDLKEDTQERILQTNSIVRIVWLPRRVSAHDLQSSHVFLQYHPSRHIMPYTSRAAVRNTVRPNSTHVLVHISLAHPKIKCEGIVLIHYVVARSDYLRLIVIRLSSLS